MAYKVVITPPARLQLEKFVSYTLIENRNIQAAKGIVDDARRNTIFSWCTG